MDKKALPLRIGVGAIVLNHKNKIFAKISVDKYHTYWNWPQAFWPQKMHKKNTDQERKNIEEEIKKEIKQERNFLIIKLNKINILKCKVY